MEGLLAEATQELSLRESSKIMNDAFITATVDATDNKLPITGTC